LLFKRTILVLKYSYHLKKSTAGVINVSHMNLLQNSVVE
jgi:hypothetical protein